MAVSLVETGNAGELVVPEIEEFVADSLTPLLYGIEKSRTPETSFLALRNRLAHGGGLTRNEAQRLLAIWQDPFEAMLGQLQWLTQLHVVGLNTSDDPIELMGVHEKPPRCETVRRVQLLGDDDGVWLVRGEHTLMLWPMVLYGPARSDNQTDSAGAESSAQVYVRKDLVRLQFTPLDIEGLSQSEAGDSALDAFQRLFELDRQNQQKVTSGFRIQGFEAEIQRDAAQMVGRYEEQAQVERCLKGRNAGVIWLSGAAGMGKSFLMARITQSLSEEFQATETLVLPYRFRAGDEMRCSRDAFVDYTVERLSAADTLIKNAAVDVDGKAEDRLKTCLDQLRADAKVIFVLDGLDEVLVRDPTFAETIPLSRHHPRVVWLCAGRPEPSLQAAFTSAGAVLPYPDGLPSMQVCDIRGMILEKIGPLKKKLLAGEKEKDDRVISPFVDLVAQRADGLPLYVKYVIGDVLSNRYRVLDGQEDLPVSLHAYHERLINGLGLSDLNAVLTPLAASLAVAKEPLAEHEIVASLVMNKVIPPGEVGRELVLKGLAALSPMLRRMPDPEGEEGFTLFHKSLRDHILTTATMASSVSIAQQCFANAAQEPEQFPSLTNYFYRTGIEHLLDNGRIDEARTQLLNLRHLSRMWGLGKTNLEILQLWNRIGDSDPAERYLEIAKSVYVVDIDEDSLQLLSRLADFMALAGWYRYGVEVARMSFDGYGAVLGAEHLTTLKRLGNFAALLRKNGDFTGAEPLYRRKLDAHKRRLGVEHQSTLSSQHNLALLLMQKGDLAEAEHLFRQTLKSRESIFGSEHRATLTSQNNLASLLRRKGDLASAEILFKQALEARERTLGVDHQDTLSSRNNFAMLLRAKGDFTGAEILHRRTLESLERTLGAGHPDTLRSQHNLALVLQQKGDSIGAERLHKRVLDARENTLGEEHPDTLASLQNYAVLLRDDFSRPADAVKYLQKALEIRRRLSGEQLSNKVASAMVALGTALVKCGQYEEALSFLEQSTSIRQKLYDKGNVSGLSLAGSLNRLADVYEKLGEIQKSEQARADAVSLES